MLQSYLNRVAAGEIDEEDREPPLGPEVIRLRAVFEELNDARQRDLGSLLPLTYSEIAAYAALRRMELTPWDVRALKMMDRIYRRAEVMGNEVEMKRKAKGG